MLEQALELRIEVLIVLHGLDPVTLRHPLDVVRRQRHRERLVAEHRLRDRLGRSDLLARRAEALLEFLTEAPEEMDVLGLLRGELEKCPRRVGLAVELWPRVVEHERQDELLYEAEDVQIAEAADLVEGQLLALAQERQWLDARERLRHERLREVEPLVPADQILDAPFDSLRRLQRPLVRVSVGLHLAAPFEAHRVRPSFRSLCAALGTFDCSRDATRDARSDAHSR